MDWVVGGFLVVGFLFFWAVWVFGYWLPMAKAAQNDFKAQEARERAARETKPHVSGATAPAVDEPPVPPRPAS